MKCRDESHGWALNATEETRNGCQYFEHGESAGGGGSKLSALTNSLPPRLFFFLIFTAGGSSGGLDASRYVVSSVPGCLGCQTDDGDACLFK